MNEFDFNTNFTESALKAYLDRWAKLNKIRLMVDMRVGGKRTLFHDALPEQMYVVRHEGRDSVPLVKEGVATYVDMLLRDGVAPLGLLITPL